MPKITKIFIEFHPAEIGVEDRVDIGYRACVFGNVRVGHDSIIGANAVVLEDVPPGCVAFGVPAKVVRRGLVSPESARPDSEAPEAGDGPTR